jgi:hypothetical protein
MDEEAIAHAGLQSQRGKNPQLGCHSVAVVLTLVQTKQIRINIHKRINT